MLVIALVSLFLFTALSQPALAYLDPGSGSMLIAGLVGLLASLLFFLKGLYYKSRRVVLGLFGKTGKEDRTRHPLVEHVQAGDRRACWPWREMRVFDLR